MARKNFGQSQIGKFMESANEPIKEDLSLHAKDNAKDNEPLSAKDKAIDTPTFKVARKKKEETKSKRVNLLIKPSLYSKANKQAKKLGYKSFNDFVNSVLEQIVEGK